MILSDELRVRLLGAIETDTLIFLCGAGLSMASPSALPSAAKVAETCFDKWSATETLAPELRTDIDALAGHFHARGDLPTFLGIVPWNELSGPPNAGHAAIADLLVSRAAMAALSANFDTMIERWSQSRRVAMRGALSGQEAVTYASVSNPLVKFHGCMNLAQAETLWTHGQLDEASVKARIQSLANWMTLHLPGKHLVIVGFWTDWGYLNSVLAESFNISNAASVTVIDPSAPDTLQTKAPELWEKLKSLSTKFTHLQASGADALNELRTEYSRAWLKKCFALAKPLAETMGLNLDPDIGSMTSEELYSLRLDAEGLPPDHAGKLKEPPQGAAESAFLRLKLMSKGAVATGALLTLDGKVIRILNGAGRPLQEVREKHTNAASVTGPDYVICAGAVDAGVPARLIASGRGLSFLRPSPGGGSIWLTTQEATAELSL
ncbi:MAG: hypothetical protein NVV62_08235 [Terricaulis sp.]|nr:hypothetical protein [Terricaulis sp.]